MKEIIAKLEALKGKMLFYDNGVDDCIKVVKEHLKSHKTRQPIEVTEGDFIDDDKYNETRFNNGTLKIALWNGITSKGNTNSCGIFCSDMLSLCFTYEGDLLKDGVIAANAALKKLYEDVSEEV